MAQALKCDQCGVVYVPNKYEAVSQPWYHLMPWNESNVRHQFGKEPISEKDFCSMKCVEDFAVEHREK